MQVAVLRFPGSNCDDDTLHVVGRVMGLPARVAWHKDAALPPGTDVVIVPGGFSYGDYLRSGAIAAHSPVMQAVRGHAERGGPVLGICNGFQILCEAGLLPGALARNHTLKFECKDVHVRVEGARTPFSGAIPAGRVLRMPIAHADGRYVHPDPAALEAAGQVIFRYCDAAGGVGEATNPNGSVGGIAGVASLAGNVVGLMPHPERAAEAILGGGLGGAAGNVDGLQVFESLVLWYRGGKP